MPDIPKNKGLALVTGASGGMGRPICETLLRTGYRVIAACHTAEKGQPFVDALNAAFPASEPRVTLLVMDLAEEDSVRRAADRVLAWNQPLDILMNNAGMLGYQPQTNQAGNELHYVVNALSPILFTRLLKPLLHRGSRVVNTVSCTVWIGRVPSHFPKPPKYFNRFSRYSDSKLVLLLLSLKLAEAWQDEGITVNAADPGIVDTPIISMHNGVIDPLCDLFFRPIIHTPAKGASTALFLALDSRVEGCTGGLYAGCKQQKLPTHITCHPASEGLAQRFL